MAKGRPPIFNKPMTGAERTRRWRAKKHKPAGTRVMIGTAGHCAHLRERRDPINIKLALRAGRLPDADEWPG